MVKPLVVAAALLVALHAPAHAQEGAGGGQQVERVSKRASVGTAPIAAKGVTRPAISPPIVVVTAAAVAGLALAGTVTVAGAAAVAVVWAASRIGIVVLPSTERLPARVHPAVVLGGIGLAAAGAFVVVNAAALALVEYQAVLLAVISGRLVHKAIRGARAFFAGGPSDDMQREKPPCESCPWGLRPSEPRSPCPAGPAD